jgi:hypothetical protein
LHACMEEDHDDEGSAGSHRTSNRSSRKRNIETHQVYQEHDSSVLFVSSNNSQVGYATLTLTQPEARPPVGPQINGMSCTCRSSPHLPCGFSHCRRCSLFEMAANFSQGKSRHSALIGQIIRTMKSSPVGPNLGLLKRMNQA